MNDLIEIKPETNVEILLKCDLVASKTPSLDEQLMEIIYTRKPPKFTIDMAEVDMVDSTGIGTLLAILDYLKNKECKLSLINLSDDIYDLFVRMRLGNHLIMICSKKAPE